MSVEFPVMRLGLVGFTAEQETALGKLLESGLATMRWESWPFAEADAWWVNGAHLKLLDNGIIRVPPGRTNARSALLKMSEVDRPVAFTLPLDAPGFEPAITFDAMLSHSVAKVLESFETTLEPIAAQFALASLVARMRGEFTSTVYHLSLGGNLLAVVDLNGAVGHLPGAQPADFAAAEWSARPLAAKNFPQHFVRTTLSEMMWQYATRTRLDLLPAHYRKVCLYFRRAPKVPQSYLKDTHLAIIRELAVAPGTFAELQQRTGIGGEAMARALSALFFSGTLTSNAKRAAPPLPTHVRPSTDSSGHSAVPSMLQADSRLSPDTHYDPTAPAPLRIWD